MINTGMRVPEMSAGIIGVESVAKGRSWWYGALCYKWNSIHVWGTHHMHSMPMNTATLSQKMILDIDHDLITLTDLETSIE